MKVGFVIFDGMTSLDFIGAYDPLGRLRTMGFLPQFEGTVCAASPQISDDRGLRYLPDKVGGSLDEFEIVVVPGGVGVRDAIVDPRFIDWIRTAEACPLKSSVCTGALILGAAGFLTGRNATTHPIARRELDQYCDTVLADRVVDAGSVVTAGGVTASIDLGLYLVARIAGEEVCSRIAAQMDYPYELRATDAAQSGRVHETE